MRSFLRAFADGGRTVLVSSHLLTEVQATVDEIVVINQGRLLAQMAVNELNLGEGRTRIRVSHLKRARRGLAELEVVIESGEDDQGPYLRVHTADTVAVGATLFNAGGGVFELTHEHHDLEAEFFALIEATT